MLPTLAGVSTYQACLALGLAAVLLLAPILGDRVAIPRRRMFLATTLLIIAAMAGSKLYWRFETGADSWGSLWRGHRNVGALVAGVALLPIAARLFRGVSATALGDVLAPVFCIALALVRTGCFLNGCCCGQTCDLPWALRFPAGSDAWSHQVFAHLLQPSIRHSLPVHPLQVYLLLTSGLVGVAGINWLARRRFDGEVLFSCLLAWSAAEAALYGLRYQYSGATQLGLVLLAMGCSLALLSRRRRHDLIPTRGTYRGEGGWRSIVRNRTRGSIARLVAASVAGLFVIAAANRAAAVVINVDSAQGVPGGTVSIGIFLDSEGEDVSGTLNDIIFNTSLVSVDSQTDCVINPAISNEVAPCKDNPPFGPCKILILAALDCATESCPPGEDGCVPIDCGVFGEGFRRLRAIVISLLPLSLCPIPDGLLYTCTFSVAEDANRSAILYAAQNIEASSPNGDILPVRGVNGRIDITPAVPTSTHSPTPTPVAESPTQSPTPTATPSAPPATATDTPLAPTPQSGFSDDSCRIVASGDGSGIWLILVAAASLFWKRRLSL